MKFARYNVRQRFMKNRKQLKGSRVGVQDLLAPFTQHLFKRARDLVEQSRHVTAAWTWDGKVMVNVIYANDKTRKVHITSQTDLHNIYHHGNPEAEVPEKEHMHIE